MLNYHSLDEPAIMSSLFIERRLLSIENY